MKIILAITTCLVLISNQSFCQDLNCEDLISYRDKGLIQIWESKQEKYRISNEAVANIVELKRNLLSDTKYANSDIQPILLTIKTLANVIGDVVGLASPQGQLINMAKQAGEVSVKSEKVYKLLKSSKKTIEIAISEDVEKTLGKQALLDLAGAQSGLAFFINIHNNIKSFQDFADMRNDINYQLIQIETSFNRYNNSLKKPYTAFKEISNYKNYIDSYLKDNCKTETQVLNKIGSTDTEANIGYLVGIAHGGSLVGNSYCTKSYLAINQEVRFTNKDYSQIWKDLNLAIREKYPSPKYQFPTKTVVLPGNSVIIYTYKVMKVNCESSVISFSKAKSMDEAKKEIDKRMKECKDCYGYSEIERWPRPNP